MQAVEMGRLSWMVWVGPKCNYKGLHKREAGGDSTAAGKKEGDMRTSTKRGAVLKMEGEVLSRGMQGMLLWILERPGVHSALQPGARPGGRHRGFSPVMLTSDFWLPEL